MGPEIAFILFMLSMLSAGGVMLVPYSRLNPEVILTLSRRMAYLQMCCLTASVLLLLWAFIESDLTVQIVARYSHATMPFMYRVCALWGGHEGALLLWIWILTAYACVVAIGRHHVLDTLRSHALSILALIYLALGSFLVITSSPFARFLPASPDSGQGLNPLLQDVGMVMHPPMLYVGYVGLSVVFAFTVIAVLRNQVNAQFARAIQSYAWFAWGALTVGIILGSWWAYRELGWGGWWFWDPVENASFMPWLAALGLLHMLMVLERTSLWIVWTVLLAALGFVLSLMGTFLVRSGILVSVHAFAEDPQRGLVLLLYFGASMIATCLLLMRCASQSTESKRPLTVRVRWMAAGSVLSMVSLLTVVIGTLYPLIAQAFFQEKVSVGASYFNQILTPIFLLSAVLSSCAVQVSARQQKLTRQWLQSAFWIVMLECVVLGLIFLNHQPITLKWVLASTVAVALAYSSLMSVYQRRASWGMGWAHVGFAVVILAAVSVSEFETLSQWSLQPGEVVKQGDWRIHFQSISTQKASNYRAREAHIDLVNTQTGERLMLKPQQRLYTDSGTALAKVAIDVGLWRDVYVALGQRLNQNQWAVRVMIKPGVRWVWYGGVLMVIGMWMVYLRRAQAREV